MNSSGKSPDSSSEKDIISDLQSRNMVVQLAGGDELTAHLAEGSRVVYCGFDPTASSLHIGSMVPLLALKRFQMAGHKPIALVGGATGMIGDPSFKDSERKLNSTDIITDWVEQLKPQLSQFLDFDCGENSALLVNNLDWTKDYDVLSFLRDVGKHFAVNAMIQKESVKQRLEREGEGISFTEFSYMILQSYDFAELNKRYDCTVQIGGSDQWGNITGGIDLTRRMHQNQVFGATLPLVTIECVNDNLGVSEDSTDFVLPIGATVNMDGTSLYQAIAVIFLAQYHDVSLDLYQQLGIVLTATLASIGAAAVPGAGLIMLMIVLESVGLNPMWVAIVLPMDRILDMCRTVINVTSDATVSAVIAKTENMDFSSIEKI